MSTVADPDERLSPVDPVDRRGADNVERPRRARQHVRHTMSR
jgi:hypothetical protein